MGRKGDVFVKLVVNGTGEAMRGRKERWLRGIEKAVTGHKKRWAWRV
jgi:hypothetical protein